MPNPSQSIVPDQRSIGKRQIAGFVVILLLALLVATGGFQTYWNQERRLVAAGNEIVTALEAFRAASPGTAKELPMTLSELMHDPRMLADKGYLTALPLDPITLKQEWGTIQNKDGKIIGVHSLSTASPTWLGRILSMQSGSTYADWRFAVADK